MIDDWWKNLTTSSPIGGIGGHRAVGVMPDPIAPSVPQPPVISIGEAGRGTYPATPYNPPYGVAPYTPPNVPIGTVAQNPMNPFGGGANISEEGAMSWWDKLKSNIDKDFLAAALGSLGDMGGSPSRSGGGGGGGGGGARVGGNVKPTGLLSPTLPDIPAIAPNPGFYTLLPRQQKDRYSGGF